MKYYLRRSIFLCDYNVESCVVVAVSVKDDHVFQQSVLDEAINVALLQIQHKLSTT